MSVNGEQTRCEFALGVGGTICANGETWEFFLTFDGKRYDQRPGLFRTVNNGDSIPAHAAASLPLLLARAESAAGKVRP